MLSQGPARVLPPRRALLAGASLATVMFAAALPQPGLAKAPLAPALSLGDSFAAALVLQPPARRLQSTSRATGQHHGALHRALGLPPTTAPATRRHHHRMHRLLEMNRLLMRRGRSKVPPTPAPTPAPAVPTAPAPAPLPPAPTAPSGEVIFTSDAERQFGEEWSGFTAASPSRFTRVAWPRAQGAYAWRVDLFDGDPGYVDGDPSQGNYPERSQQNAAYPSQRFKEGEERWIAWQMYLPESFPINDNHRQTMMQMKQGCNGPPLSLEATLGTWRAVNQADNICGNSSPTTRNSIPAVKNRWAKFTYHVKFSPDNTVGYYEVFADTGDGVWQTLQPKTFAHTMKQTNGVAVPLGFQLGYYRWEGQTGDAFVGHDGLTVATTRSAAEANAFGP